MVHSPYTPFFGDAFMAAHIAIGIMLLAFAWWSLPNTVLARWVTFAAISLAVVTPLLGDFLKSFGGKTPPADTQHDALLLSSCLVFIAVLAMRRFAIALVSLLLAVVLLKLETWVDDSMMELCALHLLCIGVVVGLVRRHSPIEAAATRSSHAFALQDLVIFIIATVAATIASIYVLQRADGSADEWAYTWQAAVFAKGHLYGAAPPCENALQNFYVFESMGKLFSQYTPGWPYFMTPFVAFGVPWLAGPFSHGLLAVGVARVARSAVRLDGRGTRTRETAAGWVAAMVAAFGTTILLCGASRYPHVFVAALFAWTLEAILLVATPGAPRTTKTRWGFILGACVALLGATRPADGATLSLGLALYFVYALARRRVGAAAFLATLAGFVVWGGLTLVILRVQLGSWFTTGYSLNKIIHPWNVSRYGWPRPNEWKFALPLATGSYAWFPCSLALGCAGLASLRRRAVGIAVICALSYLAFEVYYQYIDLARGFDWGYGPRYELPFVVPMAIGMGAALAPLAENALKHIAPATALHAGGPFAIVVCTMVVTVVRLWPLLYPGVYAHVHQHDSLNQRIRDMQLRDAIVMVQPGATGFDPLDLTENLPVDLYPNQHVLIAIERKSEFTQCMRRQFPNRTVYRAYGNPVTIVPY